MSGLPQKELKEWNEDAINDCLPEETRYRSGRFWAKVPCACAGDYTGSTLERANVEYLKEHFPVDEIGCEQWRDGYRYVHDRELHDYRQELISIAAEAVLVAVSYWYCTEEIWYDIASTNETLQEILDDLVNYPIISEEKQDELEQELLSEYMKDFCETFARNCMKEVMRGVDLQTLAGKSKEQDRWMKMQENLAANIEPVIFKVMEELNIYPEYETGCNVYIDQDKVFPAVVEYLLDPDNEEKRKQVLETPLKSEDEDESEEAPNENS